METNKESFKKMFPNLSEEIEGGDIKVPINAIRTNPKAAKKTAPYKLRNYVPTVDDFIRRCDTEKQAEEIIAFLEKKGEITNENATKLRKQLKSKGVRSFGPKKEENYYFEEGGIS